MASNRRTALLVVAALLLLLPGFALAISVGTSDIPLTDIWNSFFHYDANRLNHLMVIQSRLPRAICALITGGLLGMTSAMMQGVTRNPIAEPSLLGINQGATLMVAVCFAAGVGTSTAIVVPAAILGALLCGALILAFTMRGAGNMTISRLMLAGTAISTFLTSVTTVIGLLTGRSQILGFWISGGFKSTSWLYVWIILAAFVPGFIIALWLSPRINILSLGDDVATGLGGHPQRIRFATILVMIPICAACVVVGKTIAFVGLIIPQTARLAIGDDYRRVIPVSFLLGAVLLTWADIASRMLNAPYEVPVGIFTALLGVPFFLIMARKERG